MKWVKVVRENRVQPKKGDYNDWKDQVAAECGYQCVYCALHERRFGGRRYGHVDHFRPKGIERFAELRKVIQNLYYACAVCNCFKGDDWPADPTPDHTAEGFIDPSDHDFNPLFNTASDSFEVSSPHVACCYVIEKLYLNRPHLLAERRLDTVLSHMQRCCDRLESAVMPLYDSESPEARSLMGEVVNTLRRLREMANSLNLAIPYHSQDLKKR